MKKVVLIISAIVMLMCVSCSKNQKPSQRVKVWNEKEDSTVMTNSQKVMVPFKRMESGLAEVQVSLNGVPFNMWWDTGASVTCISLLELQKLEKEGKIKLEDFLGVATAKIADGSTTESFLITIKEIYIQGKNDQHIVLRDVSAMVSPNEKAPLLLGQNVIARLPQHSFNESTGLIEFEQ